MNTHLLRGQYKHQYCLSLHSSPEPVRITYHFEDSTPITSLITKRPQIQWIQSQFSSIKARNVLPPLKSERTERQTQHSIRTPTSPFTMILKTNQKILRYAQCEQKQYLVNRSLPSRKLGVHTQLNKY